MKEGNKNWRSFFFSLRDYYNLAGASRCIFFWLGSCGKFFLSALVVSLLSFTRTVAMLNVYVTLSGYSHYGC